MTGSPMWVLFLEVVVVSVLCAQCVSAKKGKDKPPHIVFVLADDYGFNDIGYHGSQIQTPTLDKLASDGVKLENYYVQPICTPTRSCLMSGRYQIHTGLTHMIIGSSQPNGLPLNSPTLADKMKEAGYSTHMVGKWHLGFYKEAYLPYRRGFDTYFGYLNGAEDYYNHSAPVTPSGPPPGPPHEQQPPPRGPAYLDFRDEKEPVKTEQGHYSTHLFTEKGLEVIRNHDPDTPLFLYMAYQAPHFPLMVPDQYTEMYKDKIIDEDRRTYAGMVNALDEGVMNLTQALREKLWNDTIFIFSTDNGGEVRSGGNNYPLRGWKGSLWDGGMHGIGFVGGGRMPKHGVVNKELIHVSDWYPTLVGLAQGNLNGTLPLDGVDQWDTISKGAPSKRKVLLHNIDVLFPKNGDPLYNNTWDTSVRAAIRVGDMKLLTGNPGDSSWVPPPGASLMDVPEVHEPMNKNVWLFNITADPNEHVDLSDKMPDVVKELLDQIQAFNKTSVPPRFPKDDPKADPALHGGVWGPWE